MEHIELFAGISGFGIGLDRCDIKTVALVEIDDACCKVLCAHYPEAIHIKDVREAGKNNLPLVDIITFGSPCQDLSVAGKRKGMAGERSGLFYEAVRIIRELNPTYAIWENVPGALSSNNGNDFRGVLSELVGSEIPVPKSGRWATSGLVRNRDIEVAWRILDAQFFGVPQRRRRIFVVRCARGRSAYKILFEPEGGARNIEESLNQGKEIARTVTSRIGKGGFTDPVNDNIIVAYENHPNDSRITETKNISQQLTGRMGTGGNNVPLLQIAYTISEQDDGRNNGLGGFSVSETDKSVQPASKSKTIVIRSSDVRRLTPTECSRLQGFPDDWNNWLSDTARYKQFGNAVAVPVAEWLGKRIVYESSL
jgi:DNA (cytosine-5)-methyltransferase 1